jgi:hypothetical protein
MDIKYTSWPYYIPNGRKMDQHFPIQVPDPTKFTQIGIFGLKIHVFSGNPASVHSKPLLIHQKQGCQMAFFKPFKFCWRVLDDVGIFYGYLIILRPIGKFKGNLLHFVVIWYIFPHFGVLYQEKSGNPDQKCKSIF